MRARNISIVVGCLLVAGVVLAFASRVRRPAPAPQRSIFVLAGAGMRPPMDEIGQAFQAETGIQAKYTYAGSACLLTQIDTARQGDAYMPGEKFYLEQASQRGYVVESRDIAYIIPVILVHKGNPKRIRGLKCLLRPEVRVGLGDAKATAVGKQADKVLKRAGLAQALERKHPMRSGTVPELGNAIKLGHLDAAIAWDAVAAWYPQDVEAIPIEARYNLVSTIPLAVLKFTRDREAAHQFLAFVSSPAGRAIFAKHGYSLTPHRAPPGGQAAAGKPA